MMLPETRTLFLFMVLAAGAVFSTLLMLSLSEDEQKDNRPELSLAYYLDSAELVGTAADGSVVYQLKTRHAEQNEIDESVELEDIVMTYGPPVGLPWDVRADSGRIPADASIIQLEGNVTAISGAGHPNSTVITTPRMNINPDTMSAITRSPVTVVFEDRRLYSTGMEANFRTNRLKLLSNVNGKFSPK